MKVLIHAPNIKIFRNATILSSFESILNTVKYHLKLNVSIYHTNYIDHLYHLDYLYCLYYLDHPCYTEYNDLYMGRIYENHDFHDCLYYHTAFHYSTDFYNFHLCCNQMIDTDFVMVAVVVAGDNSQYCSYDNWNCCNVTVWDCSKTVTILGSCNLTFDLKTII